MLVTCMVADRLLELHPHHAAWPRDRLRCAVLQSVVQPGDGEPQEPWMVLLSLIDGRPPGVMLNKNCIICITIILLCLVLS